METIISAAITGSLALIGVIVSNVLNNKTIENKMQTAQAVTDCKIEELTREVREHNKFALRMPIAEEKIERLEKQVHDLEGYHKEKAGN